MRSELAVSLVCHPQVILSKGLTTRSESATSLRTTWRTRSAGYLKAEGRYQESGVRSQKHALRKASGRAAQNPSQVYGDPDSFTACNFSSMDKRIRESAQLAFAPKTCVSPFRIR